MSGRAGVNDSSAESDDNRHDGHSQDGGDIRDSGSAGPSHLQLCRYQESGPADHQCTTRATGTVHVIRSNPSSCFAMTGTSSTTPVSHVATPVLLLLTTGTARTHVATPVPLLQMTGTTETHVVTGTDTEARRTGTPQVPVGHRNLESRSRALIGTPQVPTGHHRPTDRKRRRATGNDDADITVVGPFRRAHAVRVVEVECSISRQDCADTRLPSTICTSGDLTRMCQYPRINSEATTSSSPPEVATTGRLTLRRGTTPLPVQQFTIYFASFCMLHF